MERERGIVRRARSDMWNPLDLLRGFEEELDTFRRGFESILTNPAISNDIAREPLMDIEEKDDRYILHMEVPGIKKDNIDIKLKDNILSVHGRQEDEKEESNNNFILRERGYKEFRRSIRIDENVDTEKVEAKLEDGVLNLTLPKKDGGKEMEKNIIIQ